MKLHVLGCHGLFPPAGGATSGYMLCTEGRHFLLDCGSGVLGRLMALGDPASLCAVLLSHLHFDHAADLLVLSYYLQQRGKRLPVYVPPEDESPLRGLLSPAAYHVLPYPETLALGPLKVTTCPTRHPVPCRALRLEAEGKTLVYTGDTNTCPGLAAFASGADVLLADAAFTENEWSEKAPHLCAREAARLALESNARALRLTHLPVGRTPAALEKEAAALFPNTKAVSPGEVILI